MGYNSTVYINGNSTIKTLNYLIHQCEYNDPDIVILCVNIHDDIQYIERTVRAIEGICECKVIAFCIYPKKVMMNNGVIKKNLIIDNSEYMNYSKLLYDKFEIDAFILDDLYSINNLYEKIINYLS